MTTKTEITGANVLEHMNDDENAIAIHNEHCEGDDTVHDFSDPDSFFEDYFSKTSDAVRATIFGEVNWSDNYIWFNGYANLETSDSISGMPIDLDQVLEWVVEASDVSEYKEVDGDEWELRSHDALDEFVVAPDGTVYTVEIWETLEVDLEDDE